VVNVVKLQHASVKLYFYYLHTVFGVTAVRVLVLGAGRVGSVVAEELSRDYDVAVADSSLGKLSRFESRARITLIDARDAAKLADLIKGFDVVVDALPGSLGYGVLKLCTKLRRNLVDVSFMPEDPLPLSKEVEEAGIVVAVDAGFAPGLSNAFVGRMYAELGEIERAVINVGGLPKEPRPPLYHLVLFSPYDLIDEYLRPARLVRDYKVVEVDPLSIIERVRVGPFELEMFPTDGLRTLLHTVRAREMAEYTLRWPGHLERMRVLKELGFFKPENLDRTLAVILPLMQYESPDLSLMEVVVTSASGWGRLYLYDEAAGGHTSMARVTGFVTSATARLLIEGRLPKGLTSPEKLGVERELFNYVVEYLRARGVKVEVTYSPP